MLEEVLKLRHDDARWVVGFSPHHDVALVWFGVVWLALPLGCLEKEVKTLVVTLIGYAVLSMNKLKVFGFDRNAYFFLCFAKRCVDCGLTTIQMPGRQTIFTVMIPGMRTPAKQYFAVSL
jgi:cephalosporin-C deacetylase-like acetyl esterase